MRSTREPRMSRPSSEMRRPSSDWRSSSHVRAGSTCGQSGKARTDLDERQGRRRMVPTTPLLAICCVAAYAARVSGSFSGSGAGPQMYAMKRGAGSAREPREITIPTGSSSPDVRADIFIRQGPIYRGVGAPSCTTGRRVARTVRRPASRGSVSLISTLATLIAAAMPRGSVTLYCCITTTCKQLPQRYPTLPYRSETSQFDTPASF